MSPIPEANEPANNSQAPGEGGALDPPPQGYDSVLNTGNMSSDEEGSDGGGESSEYTGYQLLVQDPEPEQHGAESEDEMEGAMPGEIDSDISDQRPQQELVSAGAQASGRNPDQLNLPSHLAKLLPSTTPAPDATTQVTHTDTHASLEQRKMNMATDDQIRAAMVGFSLPTAAIPPWARSVNEDDWKEQLVARIQTKHDIQHTTPSTQQESGENG